MKFGVYFLATFMSLAAHAGAGASGGGNSVICFDTAAIPSAIRNPDNGTHYQKILDSDLAHITFIEALDLYKAKRPVGLQSKPNPVIELKPGESERAYVERIAKRFDSYVPFASKVARAGIGNFPESQVTVDKIGVTFVDDSLEVSEIDSKEKCVVATMAVQYEEGRLHFLEIDDRLLHHPKNSPLSRAVLVLHESVYSVARDLDQNDSRSTRLLIKDMISQNIDIATMNSALNNLGFNYPWQDVDNQYLAQWAKAIIDVVLPQAQRAAYDVLHDKNTINRFAVATNAWIDKYHPRTDSGLKIIKDDDYSDLYNIRDHLADDMNQYGVCNQTYSPKGCLEDGKKLVAYLDTVVANTIAAAKRVITEAYTNDIESKIANLPPVYDAQKNLIVKTWSDTIDSVYISDERWTPTAQLKFDPVQALAQINMVIPPE